MESRQLRQTLAEGCERCVHGVELEAVDGGRRLPAGKETLSPQRRQGLLDTLAAALAEPAARPAVGQQPRHGAEVEQRVMRAPEGRLQRRLLERSRRAGLVGPQDVAEPDHQAVDAFAGDARLVLLHRRPGVAQEARRQGRIAVGHLAIDFERLPDLAGVASERVVAVGRERLQGTVPQLRQRAALAHGREPPDLALDLESPAAQGLARHPGRRNGAQRRIDRGTQRQYALATAGREDHREVVTQRVELAVRGHQRRPHSSRGGGDRGTLDVATGEVEDDLGAQFLVHARHGQTVNLSNSASSEVRMVSVVRSMPERRRSS